MKRKARMFDRQSFLLIFLVAACIATGFLLGNNYSHRQVQEPAKVITLEDAISYLECAKESHQYYIDYPQLQNKGTGNTTFSQGCVDRYQEIIDLFRE